jgi:hypothetical protein
MSIVHASWNDNEIDGTPPRVIRNGLEEKARDVIVAWAMEIISSAPGIELPEEVKKAHWEIKHWAKLFKKPRAQRAAELDATAKGTQHGIL